MGSACFYTGDPTALAGDDHDPVPLRTLRGSSVRLDSIGDSMNIHLSLAPLISLVAGILILVVPRLLNFIVAIYLIVIGLIGLFGAGAFHLN